MATPNQAIVPWKERLAQLAKQTEDAEKPTGNFITFRAGQMLFNDNPVPGNKMLAVPIDYIFENAFYPEKFNPAKAMSPICYAFGRKDSELKPHADCEDPQNTTCDGCELNEWGSDPDGGKGKACKNTRRIALLHKDSLVDAKTILESAVAFCKIPVTSVKNWSTFANQCATVLKVPPLAVIAEVSVIPDSKTQFQVLFKGSGVISDDEILAALVAKQEMVAKNIMVPYPKNAQKEEAPPVTGKGKKYS
jgi:hypothetical protein